MKRLGLLAAWIALTAALLCACVSAPALEMHDGYYMAECAQFDAFGWKEYIMIYVNNHKIVTVEYNAKNASGFIKSWDMEYMRSMNAISGTYPNKYTRAYAAQLLNRQNPASVDVISGATHSHTTFQFLAEAAIKQAVEGDKNVVFVEIPHAEASH